VRTMNKAVKKNASMMPFSELALKIQSGSLVDLPKQICVDLESISLNEYEALLELVRYKSFGSRALKTVSELPGLQEIRALIHSGSYQNALDKLEKFDQDDPTTKIEIARCLVFTGQFEQVVALLVDATRDSSIPAQTRGTANQLVGHAFFEAADLPQSKLYLERALELGYFSGNTLGIVSARLFLSRIAFFQNDFVMCDKYLHSVYDEIKKLGSFKWFLGYYRNLSHYYYFKSDLRCLTIATAAKRIAVALGDQLFAYRSEIEMEFMKRHFGFKTQINDEIIFFSEVSESDLSHWIRAFSGDPSTSYSMLRFFERSNSPVPLDSPFEPPQNIGWIFDTQENTFIDVNAATTLSLFSASPVGKLLKFLKGGKSFSTEEVFENVWKLPWNSERHQNVVDVAIHRFNKILKTVKIIREEGVLRLNLPGLII